VSLEEGGRLPGLAIFMQTALTPLKRFKQASRMTIYFEPGRWLVDEAFCLLATVLEVKVGDNKQVLVCNASITTLPLAVDQPLVVFTFPIRTDDMIQTKIYGSSCMEDDVLADNLLLPTIRVGEVLAFCQVGAYNMAKASQFMFPRPGVVMMGVNNQIMKVRRPETNADLWERDDWKFKL